MDLGVRGRAYILVGGTRGMGWEAARALAADGANLALIARNERMLAERAADLTSTFGVKAAGIPADSASAGSVEAAIAEAVGTFGVIRGLLVTTGMTDHNGKLLDMSEEDWKSNFDDVLMGTVRPCRAIVPHFIENGGGNIVTTSAYSIRDVKDFLFGYSSLKAAVTAFTKNLAKTYGEFGIRANCICPGAFATERVQARIDAAMSERSISRKEAEWYVMNDLFHMPVALRRPGQAHEIGDMMAYLLSERSAYATGAVINVDGGTDF